MANPQVSFANNSAAHFREILADPDALDPRPRAIYIGVSGTIGITNDDATATTEAAVAVVAGTTIPCQFHKITAVTTAKIYGLYG